MENNEEMDKEVEKEDLTELHEKALKKYKTATDSWQTIFNNYRSDYKFANGDQWDSGVLKNRKINNRSALVYNKLPANIKFIVNNARSCTPEIKVHPIADGASKNTAKVLDGIIKSIQYKSNAKQAYVKALETAVIGGLGCFRVLVEDIDADNKPEIVIKVVKDPTLLLIDPAAENSDLSDANFAFFTKWIPKDVFEEMYPECESAAINKEAKEWYKDDSVQVVEYWIKNDSGRFEYYLLSGEEVLESNTKYPGKYLPFCFVGGSETFLDGERDFKGIVRDVIDQQKMLNYSKSETADFITRSSKQQWIVEADQIADYQEIWDNQNIESYNYLPYKAGSNGNVPKKNEPAVPPSGYMATSQEADNDIRSTIGIRDPLQDIPSSQSGKAIQLQISQGNLGTFQYLDNLNAAIKYCGTIIVDLIPHFYNYPHIREIMGLDENITPTPIMQMYEDNGEMVMHDLQKGNYLVTISTGASYESQRSETADKLMELVQKYPNMMQLAGDLIVQNLDFKGSEELADRLRASIPPNILAASNNTNGDKNQALQMMGSQMQQMQAQMQQMMEQNNQLQQALQQAQAQINDKNQDRQIDMQKKQMELENQKQLKQMDIEFQMRKLVTEKRAESEMIDMKANLDLNTKLVVEDKVTENDVDLYFAKAQIDLESNLYL